MKFKPKNIRPPDLPNVNEEILRQIGTGSQRTKQTVEVEEFRSKNFIEGTQGWRLGEQSAELNDGAKVGGWILTGTTIESSDGSMKIDSTNKRIIINDGSNDRVLIGFQSGGF